MELYRIRRKVEIEMTKIASLEISEKETSRKLKREENFEIFQDNLYTK